MGVIKLRNGTTAEWTAANPVLELGEPGYDSDLYKLRLGDGFANWSGLNSKFEGQYTTIGVTTGTTPYAASNRQILFCDCIGGTIVVNLPGTNASDTYSQNIKIKKTDDSVYGVQVVPVGYHKIEDATSLTLTEEDEAVELMTDNDSKTHILIASDNYDQSKSHFMDDQPRSGSGYAELLLSQNCYFKLEVTGVDPAGTYFTISDFGYINGAPEVSFTMSGDGTYYTSAEYDIGVGTGLLNCLFQPYGSGACALTLSICDAAHNPLAIKSIANWRITAEANEAVPATTWGTITGTITDQADLVAVANTLAQKVVPASDHNFAALAIADGNLEDSGYDAADFAPVANGVTNGDSHAHTGGAGAQIDHGGLGGLADDDHPQYRQNVNHTKTEFEQDFLSAATIATSFLPWIGAATSTGTTASVVAPSADHPGCIAFSSHASNLNSGARIVMGGPTAVGIILKGGESSELIFNCPTTTKVRVLFGFFSSWGQSADNITGVMIAIDETVLKGHVDDSGDYGPQNTGTTYTITATVWYRAKLTLSANMGTANFYLYTCSDGVLVWSDSITLDPDLIVNLQAQTVMHGACAQKDTAGVAQLLTLDYINMITGTLVR